MAKTEAKEAPKSEKDSENVKPDTDPVESNATNQFESGAGKQQQTPGSGESLQSGETGDETNVQDNPEKTENPEREQPTEQEPTNQPVTQSPKLHNAQLAKTGITQAELEKETFVKIEYASPNGATHTLITPMTKLEQAKTRIHEQRGHIIDDTKIYNPEKDRCDSHQFYKG